MDKSSEIFAYLKQALIAWKYKDTNNTINGIGFNDTNVMNIEVGSLPSATVFDYVFIAPPIVTQSGVTTGARHVQSSTQTYVLDIYCKREGVGNNMKRATLEAMHENTAFISNLFARQGFIVSLQRTDLNYSNNGTARQVMSVTKTFITN